MERKVQEIEIALEPLDFKEKIKVLNQVLDNMYHEADVKYTKATEKAYSAKAQKEIIKELKDGKE
jgi:lipid II:glycine glycyltransferase (peptidoglycan interpeptide bridge formation enzyme)